jgi:SAM-dependent methyltransferase
MNWKIKALVQNTISYLPSSLSYTLYYFLQRNLGSLKEVNPVTELTKGIDIWKTIEKQGKNPSNKTFFEVGTGRIALVPLSFWLMGAHKTITIDANPYIKTQLIRESLQYILDNKEEINNLFGNLLDNRRWEIFLSFAGSSNYSKNSFLKLCNIIYIAPGDAANSYLKNDSIDFHISNLVFEHIPLDILERILIEGNRIVRKGGLFIHDIDYSDHFSHSDLSISAAIPAKIKNSV